ncbi:MAG: hypothetical protein RQ735_05225 [Flavobacteriaceae bacterium]|nr:hypothetical protein [Flavobacteriaceae bacterium]
MKSNSTLLEISEFTYLLNNPEAVTKAQTTQLKTVLDEFPYFHSGRAIYLKGLQQQESYLFDDALKTMAAHTANRAILFDYITANTFEPHQTARKIQNNEILAHNLDVVDLEVIDPSGEHPEKSLDKATSDAILDKDLFEEKMISKPAVSSTLDEDKKLVNFNPKDRHSFEDWLHYAAPQKPSKDAANGPAHHEARPNLERNKKFELIDRFLAESPKIVPEKDHKTSLNINSAAPEAEIMTETLAKVYTHQKKFKKAIKAYKILSLKYPEKSGYFADQIRALQALDKNN